MNDQQAFDAIWGHFVVNGGQPSINPDNGLCQYRDEEGNRCAIGVLIPDSIYTYEMEEAGSAIGLLAEFDGVLEPILGWINQNLLVALQQAHDTAALTRLDEIEPDEFEVRFPVLTGEPFPVRVEANLRAVAAAFDLAVPA